MRDLIRKIEREQLPAIFATAVFHVVLIVLLLNAIPKQTPPATTGPETQVVFIPLPMMEAVHKPVRRQRAANSGSTAITTYFNPYSFSPQTLAPSAGQQRLSLALASCAPDNWDNQTEEVKAACTRIHAVVLADPGRFGVTTDIKQSKVWERELLRQRAPYLAPCMTPGGPDVLYLLYCVYDVLFHGYDREKMPRYSE